MRHAKSAYPGGVPDHDRPLGPRGRRDAPVAGRWLRLAGCAPDYVLCSTARRARETWQLAEGGLGARPPVAFEPGIYEASAVSLLELVRRLPGTVRTLLVVGHDPGLPQLGLVLAAENATRERQAAVRTSGTASDRIRAKFPTAAIAVLEFSGPWSELAPSSALLTGFATPREMRDMPPVGRGEQR
jgi:phosphohistidine phosphatase